MFFAARLSVALLAAATLNAQSPGPWVDLFPKGSLDSVESIGDGIWHALSDGAIVGERDRRAASHQAWIYTKKDYRQFDLRFDYWLRHNENSGISIRDTSRARWAHGVEWDPNKTRSHIGYEIQIYGGPIDRYSSGSLYLFQAADKGHERFDNWNSMEIQARDDLIRVFLNGVKVMEHPGDPARSKFGPIGFQLHDAHTVIMFKDVKIREIPSPN